MSFAELVSLIFNGLSIFRETPERDGKRAISCGHFKKLLQEYFTRGALYNLLVQCCIASNLL